TSSKKPLPPISFMKDATSSAEAGSPGGGSLLFGWVRSSLVLWDWVGFVTPVDAHSEKAHITQTCNNCHLEHKFQYGLPKAAVQSRCFECHIPIKDDVNLKGLPRAP
ncbi:MAG: hypothetical protein QGH26_04620, partial [Candidatus Pacebacteria bacterium]|nr:hypothetical protein [Candidatus Paceibacterota bacterium]